MRAQEGGNLGDRGARSEDAGDSGLFEIGAVGLGDDATRHHQHVACAGVAQCGDELRQQRRMGTREDRAADDVDILFDRSGDDGIHAAAQPCVDHLEAFVAQAPRQHLGAAIVSVEARLGDEHANRRRSLSHAARLDVPCRAHVPGPASRAAPHRCAANRASPRSSSPRPAGVRRALPGRDARR